ncbi:sensor histidine kinase [Paenibacillus piscarius]|uniref:sensor histidine kinase n=1 Tax=Paenibacillus piscarius TaxID=1089681 RepID=UPI001EE96A61|nr:histidine kinase [Paenibacillus piscarius]
MRTYFTGKLRSFSSRIGRLSIQAKLILTYILVILIPTTVFSFYILDANYQNSITSIVNKNEYFLNTEKNNILNHMKTMELTSQLAQSDKEVLDYLLSNRDFTAEELINFNTHSYHNLQYIMYNNPNISNLRFFTGNKYAREIWPIIYSEHRIAGEDWVNAFYAQPEASWWTIYRGPGELRGSVEGERQNQMNFASLIREIKYPLDQHLALLQVNMRLDVFFSNIYGNLQETSTQVLAIDRSSQLYYNGGSAFYDKIAPEDIQRQVALNARGSEGNFRFTHEGIPYLCVYTGIERLDIKLLSVVSLESSYNDMNVTRLAIGGATLLLVLILSLITYKLLSVILKRLHLLRDSMKKVRQGDFNVEIPQLGGDEVGELGNHIRQMLSKINELIAEAVNKQASAQEAELNSLKNQIDAHFLYNTLENLKMLAEIEGQLVISDTLTSLGAMLRYNLHWTTHYVRLYEEIQHIQNYVAVMNVRYSGRLELRLDVPHQYRQQEILKMSLQPIVENALKYGMNGPGLRRRGLIIVIHAYEQDGFMYVEIRDNGAGIAAERLDNLNRAFQLEPAATAVDSPHVNVSGGQKTASAFDASGSGIGLRNVHMRIQLHYGKASGLWLDSVEGEYTKVTLKVPYLILSGGLAE